MKVFERKRLGSCIFGLSLSFFALRFHTFCVCSFCSIPDAEREWYRTCLGGRGMVTIATLDLSSVSRGRGLCLWAGLTFRD